MKEFVAPTKRSAFSEFIINQNIERIPMSEQPSVGIKTTRKTVTEDQLNIYIKTVVLSIAHLSLTQDEAMEVITGSIKRLLEVTGSFYQYRIVCDRTNNSTPFVIAEGMQPNVTIHYKEETYSLTHTFDYDPTCKL